MYEVGLAADVRAFHVMPGVEGPEGELHAHDYKIEVLIERRALDGKGMVCDLDVLEAALGEATGVVRDANLEIIRPDGVDAVTVEVFARWAHDTLADAVRRAGGETLTVRVWESSVAFGGYRAAVT
jgi:6-pyruvoyltetrahydropterin/6-carboxytetrahydropterin synthase